MVMPRTVGRYAMYAVIAEGGMARMVAIKTLHSEYAPFPPAGSPPHAAACSSARTMDLRAGIIGAALCCRFHSRLMPVFFNW